MADLDNTARQGLRDFLMRRFGYGITKDELRAAIDATDTWIDTNSGAFNAALPAAAQAGLTFTQKTLLFCYVALKRAGIEV